MKFKSWGLALAAGLLISGSALATTVKKLELPELVKESDTIVQGRVDQVYTQWDANLKVIFTYVSIDVEEPIKGGKSSTLLIRQLGGQVGNMHMTVVGMPKFTQGADHVLFLHTNGDGTYHVVGLGQGKYTVSNQVAISDTSGLDMVDGQMHEVTSGTLVDRELLANFKAKIRGLLK